MVVRYRALVDPASAGPGFAIEFVIFCVWPSQNDYVAKSYRKVSVVAFHKLVARNLDAYSKELVNLLDLHCLLSFVSLPRFVPFLLCTFMRKATARHKLWKLTFTCFNDFPRYLCLNETLGRHEGRRIVIKKYIWPWIEPFFKDKRMEPIFVVFAGIAVIYGILYTVGQLFLG